MLVAVELSWVGMGLTLLLDGVAQWFPVVRRLRYMLRESSHGRNVWIDLDPT